MFELEVESQGNQLVESNGGGEISCFKNRFDCVAVVRIGLEHLVQCR